MDPFVAEIRILACSFAPKGWAMCNGQLLPISQNTALFSLLGTFYGGNGTSTFALPDLRGSVAISWGQSSTGTSYFLGQSAGVETVTLLTSEMPAHTHNAKAVNPTPANQDDASANVMLAKTTGANIYKPTATGINPMAEQALAPAGSSAPHNNMMPYLALNFCIALQGVFPPRT